MIIRIHANMSPVHLKGLPILPLFIRFSSAGYAATTSFSSIGIGPYDLGSILGYDGFDIEKGMEMLQSFYDSFAPAELDAEVGFVFTPDDLF